MSNADASPGGKSSGIETDNSPQASDKVKNKCSCRHTGHTGKTWPAPSRTPEFFVGRSSFVILASSLKAVKCLGWHQKQICVLSNGFI